MPKVQNLTEEKKGD